MKRIILIFLIFSGAVLSCREKESSNAEPASRAIRIKVAPVIRTDMVDTIRIYGKIRLRQESFLASQFDGRLSDFNLLLGDKVRKGERIGTIIPPQREALLQILSQIDKKLRPVLEKQIKSIPLYSPLDGTVLKVLRHSGDVIQKGEPIIRIGDLRVMDVIGDLPVRYLPLTRNLKQMGVSFVNYPHDPVSLPVAAVSGDVDETKQTVAIRLSLDNSSKEFRPGMLVQMFFPGRVHKNALVVPRQALLEDEGVYSVFVLKGNKVERRRIFTGIKQNERIEVLSGLKEGERVAVQKAYSLVDGTEVVVE
ncbi:MAG: efflux RND transporter periplasmic adaptor subunit [Calditrichaeota bacterium]|nr:efflux RND transporter periplasmic adaptor subunit [Calditrichota bacterium]